MALESIGGIFDCNGRYAAGRSYVYAIMARDGDGPMYVKFGRSGNPIERVAQVQTGCPFPFIRAMMVKCLSVGQSQRIERKLHQEFADFGSGGEWFRFDWSRPDHKQLLQNKLELVLSEQLREWLIEPIDLAHAMAMQRAIVAQRKARSRSNARRRTKIFKAAGITG